MYIYICPFIYIYSNYVFVLAISEGLPLEAARSPRVLIGDDPMTRFRAMRFSPKPKPPRSRLR